METQMADLYVSPTGLDTNTGFSPDQPLRTIQRAIDMVRVPEREDEVELAEGLYDNGVTARPGAKMTIRSQKK